VTPRLDTDRLSLVPLRPDNASEMVSVLADPDMYAFIGGGPRTVEELAAVYHRWDRGSPRPSEVWHNWVIRRRDGEEAVGHVQATVVESDRSADIGWMVGTMWQGRGYATEAARAIVGWLEAQGLTSISAFIHPENLASVRVAERAGLEPSDEIVDGEVAWRRAVSAY
jgi:RimJ/RimL family protein N-acetyltransferase